MERFYKPVKEIIKVDVANSDLPVLRDALWDIGVHDVQFGVNLRKRGEEPYYSSVFVDCVDGEEPRIRSALIKRNIPFEIAPLEDGYFDG